MNSLLQSIIASATICLSACFLGPAAAEDIPMLPPAAVGVWQWIPDNAAPTDAHIMTAAGLNTGLGGWQDALVGQDVFQGRAGYAWFRTTLPNLPSVPHRFHFGSVDDNAVVYLNGKQLMHHEGWNDPFDAQVGSAWRVGGPNVLTVLVQNTSGPGGIMGPVEEDFSDPLQVSRGDLAITVDPSSGGLTAISNTTDPFSMNWIHTSYVWGTGWLRSGSERLQWQLTGSLQRLPRGVYLSGYQAGPLEILVRRSVTEQGCLNETYTFTNRGATALSLSEGDIGIQTPFNDSYAGGSAVCVPRRCNAHIWCGGTTAYVCAMRMGGAAPHLGLVLTHGSLTGYTIDNAHSSDDRGLISLNPAATTLAPGRSETISWTLFWHQGWNDFFAKALKTPAFTRLEASQYSLAQGEATTITAIGRLRDAHLTDNGRALQMGHTRDGLETTFRPVGLGDHMIHLTADGRDTFLRLLVTPSPIDLIRSRVLFIVRHQQRNAPGTDLDGAYLSYDNDTDSQVWESNNDHDAGRERLAMGCLIARYLLTCHDASTVAEVRPSLDRYYAFVNRELTDENGTVYNDVGRQDTGRLYNYPWVAELHVLMYRLTGNTECLQRFVDTIHALYGRGGYGFYCIGLPISEGLAQLKSAGMTSQYQEVLDDFTKQADAIAANGVQIPSSEVSYEQSIVAPAVQILSETYLVTHEKKYLQSALSLRTLMESFNGQQPDYHLNNIAIRHWDDYWFGKSRQYGDTFPHYWSTITAVAFHDLSIATSDPLSQTRAEEIVANNLCLFQPDGRASCAYVYPLTVDGSPGRFFDAWANDQDWALDNYLIVHSST